MEIFGIKFLKEGEYSRIVETMDAYRRTLEDNGWINLSNDPNSQDSVVRCGLEVAIKNSRLYYYNNPQAGLWIDLTTNFIFGEGISTPRAKEKSFQPYIDKFWDDPDNKKAFTSLQAQYLNSNKLQYEGNLFIVLYDDEAGDVRVRIFNALDVKDIICDENDHMRPLYYKLQEIKRRYDYVGGSYNVSNSKSVYYSDCDNPVEIIDDTKIPIDARREGRILHIKINCDINDKMGVPVLYRGVDWMKAHKNMAEDLATLIRSLSKFAWKKKVKGGQAVVNSIKGAMNAKLDLRNLPGAAGGTQIENDGVDLQAITIPTGGAKIGTDGLNQMQLQICAASKIMQHYYGDPSTGNLATAESMELPMLRNFSMWQWFWASIYDMVLQYMLNRKMLLGIIPAKIEYNYKTQRWSFETDLDRTIDIDFPPIVNTDLSKLAAALSTAESASFITKELGARQFMQAMNINNIDEEMEKLELDWAEKEKKAQEEMKMNTGAFDVNSPRFKKNLSEAIEAPVKNTGRTEDRVTRKNTFLNQRMNAYRKSISGNFNILRKRIDENIQTKKTENYPATGTVKNHDMIVHQFIEQMSESAKRFFPEAVEIGKSFGIAELKKYKKAYETNVKEAYGNGVDKILEEKIRWNRDFLENSLMVAMLKKITEAMKKTYDTEEEFETEVKAAVLSFEARLEQYVGAFWTVEEAAVKEVMSGSGLMVNFVGPDDEHDCPECEEAVNNGPYEIDNAPVPGTLMCGNNCRHALQVVGEAKDV